MYEDQRLIFTVIRRHSYGSIPGASALKGLARPKDGTTFTDNSSGHVIGFLMMATGFAQTGVSFLDALGGKPGDFWTMDKENGYAVLTDDASGMRDLFYPDLPEEEGDLWLRRLTKQSLKSLIEGGEHVYGGWMDVPCWFLATTEDVAFLVQMQKMLVQMAQDAGGDVTLREIASSHSPMLSMPEQTASFILEALAAFSN